MWLLSKVIKQKQQQLSKNRPTRLLQKILPLILTLINTDINTNINTNMITNIIIILTLNSLLTLMLTIKQQDLIIEFNTYINTDTDD